MAGRAVLRRGQRVAVMLGGLGACTLACAVTVGVLSANPVGASPPPLAAKRAQAQRVLNQIHALDLRLEQTVEAYNRARVRVVQIRHERAAHRLQLRFARRQLAIAQYRLGARLRAIYTSGEDDSTLAILLGSESPSDFIDRWGTVSTIVAHDRQVLDEVTEVERQLTLQDHRLENAQQDQERLIAAQAAAREKIEAGLRRRRRLASSIKVEIAHLQIQERAQQERLRTEVLQRLAAKQGPQLRALQAAIHQDIVGASAVSPDGAVTVAPPSPYTRVVLVAIHYLGVPYVWGGATPAGFDCSGLMMYAYAKVGVSLPHFAADQFTLGVPIARSDLQPGDLVFFHKLGHVGMYIGDGYFIQAPHAGDVVKISSLSEPWFAATYVGARRIL